MRHVLFSIAALFLMIGTAQADGLYLKGCVNAANLSEINTDNIGYCGEVGWIMTTSIGDVAVGAEYSDHVHLGNSTQGAAANATVYLTDWVVRPYATGGLGMTFEGTSFGQAGGGLMWTANDDGESGSFNIYAGYRLRCYELSNGCDSRDGFAEGGIVLTF